MILLPSETSLMIVVRFFSVWLFMASVTLTAESSAQGYGQYYSRNVTARPDIGSNLYLYDKYFYHNEAVSPYLSAVRGGSDSGTAYYTSVLPELERRRTAAMDQAAYVQQRKLQGNVGYTANPGAGYPGAMPGSGYRKPVPPGASSPSAYQSHWYGGWSR